MNPVHTANCERLRHWFEGREAIYIEDGALRVRVYDIRPNVARRLVEARVEEIRTPGLEVTPFHQRSSDEWPPLKWDIEAGFLSLFSESSWMVGYGSWSLCTEPSIVAGVVALAATFREPFDSRERYAAVLTYLDAHPVPEDLLRVFPDASE